MPVVDQTPIHWALLDPVCGGDCRETDAMLHDFLAATVVNLCRLPRLLATHPSGWTGEVRATSAKRTQSTPILDQTERFPVFDHASAAHRHR